MKVEIQKEFVDKYTKQLYKAGTSVDFSDERIAEINKVNPDLIAVVKEVKEEKEATKTKHKKEKVEK